MTTPRIRSLVSLAAALTVTLVLGGCASAPSRNTAEEPAPSEKPTLAIRFDNEAHDYVNVYLVGVQREWLLGRVEPGARAMLRLPDAALAENSGSMWLAVLVGGRTTMQAAREPRAAMTIPQPVTAFLTQRWTFSQMLATGELTPRPLGRAGQEVGPQ
jgi:hypothetical protein